MRTELPPDRPRLSVTLPDGREALLSPLTSEDRAWLEEGLTELSEQSRYSRFGLGIANLSPRQLDYLSDVDLKSHVAFGASIGGEGAGVGRYIVLEERGCAEVAVTVLDRFQGKGLGKALLGALVAIARHDDLEEFCFEVIPGNSVVQDMLEALNVVTSTVDGLKEGRLAIAEIPVRAYETDVVAVVEASRA